MEKLNIVYPDGGEVGTGTRNFTVQADSANAGTEDITKTFTVTTSDGKSKQLNFIQRGKKVSVFRLSYLADSIVWNDPPNEMLYLGTQSHPYTIRIGKSGGEQTLYAHSTINDNSTTWSMETVTASDLISVTPTSGEHKTAITIKVNSNLSTTTYTAFYKLTLSDTNAVIYLLIIQEPYTVFSNFNTLQLSYKYDSGADLDTATFVNLPGISGSYFGYKGTAGNNSTYGSYVQFSGDDVSLQSGEESVLINMKDLVDTAISKGAISNSNSSLDIDVYANWYGSERNSDGKYTGDHDNYDSPLVIKGSISDILIRTYSGDTFTTASSGSATKEWIPSGSNTLLSELSVFESGIFINAADNLNYKKVKDYYSHAFTFRYDVASDSTTVIPGDYTTGINSEFYVRISEGLLTNETGHGPIWDTDPKNREMSAGYNTHKEISTDSVIPITVVSTIADSRGDYLPHSFTINKNSNAVQQWKIYDSTKTLIGNNKDGAITITPTSESTLLYIKRYEPQPNYGNWGYYAAIFGVSQDDSPEYMNLLINISGTEPTEYYANLNKGVLLEKEASSIVATNVRTNKLVGSTYTFEEAWFKLKSNGDFYTIYSDSACSQNIEDGTKLTTNDSTNANNPFSNVWIKSNSENTSPYVRISEVKFANAGDNGLHSGYVWQKGTFTADVSMTSSTGKTSVSPARTGVNFRSTDDAYQNSYMWYEFNSSVYFYAKFEADTVTVLFSNASNNGVSFTPTLLYNSEKSTVPSTVLVSCSGNTATISIAENTEGWNSKYVALDVYNGSTLVATVPITALLQGK